MRGNCGSNSLKEAKCLEYVGAEIKRIPVCGGKRMKIVLECKKLGYRSFDYVDHVRESTYSRIDEVIQNLALRFFIDTNAVRVYDYR